MAFGQKVVDVIEDFPVSTTPVVKTIGNRLCTIHVLDGIVNVDGIMLTGAIDMHVVEDVTLVSNATGANVQIIIWG